MSQDPPTAWEQEHMPILQSFNYVGRHTQIVLELRGHRILGVSDWFKMEETIQALFVYVFV